MSISMSVAFRVTTELMRRRSHPPPPPPFHRNLGTIAKSGTSDFLKEADGVSKETQGNLIGQFGE